MSNVKTGDLAYIVRTFQISQRLEIPRAIYEVGQQASGVVIVHCTDRDYKTSLKPGNLHWWCTVREPMATFWAADERCWVYATTFPVADELLRKISGPEAGTEDHTEIFSPDPIDAEERVRVKEMKQRAARKLLSTP